MNPTINELSKAAYENAVAKGFYENPPSILERLCLIHSEVSEACEADRIGHYVNNSDVARETLAIQDNEDFKLVFTNLIKSSFEDELADVVIRGFDLAASRGIDLQSHILAKMRYNSLRPHKHGKKY